MVAREDRSSAPALRAFGKLARGASFVLGTGLLLLVTPHVSPWDMTWLDSSSPFGAVRFDLGALGFQAQAYAIYALCAALLVLVLGVHGPVRSIGAALARSRRGRVALAGAIALMLFTLVPLGRGREVVLGLALGSAGLALVLAAAWPTLARPAERAFCYTRSWVLGTSTPRFLLGLFVWVFGVTNLGAWLVFGHVPHVVDDICQLFHARIFLTGRLVAPVPALPEFFELTHMIDVGGWYSQYPPGHTLLLACGLLVGAPWLVNPLAGSLSVVLLYFIGKEAHDEATGRLSALLGAASPFLILVSSSFVSHGTTLVLLELFLLGYLRMMRRRRRRDGALAGAALGYALTIRPLTAAAIALPGLVLATWRLVRETTGDARRARRLLAAGLVAAAACALPVGALCAFNQATNGSPWIFGYEVAHGAEALPGFGHGGFRGIPHTPARGLAASCRNLAALNQYLFGLPLPSLLLPLCGLLLVRRNVWDGLFLAAASTLVLAYFFYWYQDLALGPRFLYEASPGLIVLAARGVRGLPDYAARAVPGLDRERASAFTFLALAVAFGCGVIANGPALARFHARAYADADRAVADAIDESALAGSVVFVPGYLYPSVFARNAPDLDGPVVYARDLGSATNPRLAERYPERRLYRLAALERYVLLPYAPSATAGARSWALPTAAPLTVEALTFQTAQRSGGDWRNERTGQYGGQWLHHDHLRLSAADPGAGVGFILDAATAADRDLVLQFSVAPDFGIVGVWLNGNPIAPAVDLFAERESTRRLAIERAGFRAGANALRIEVVGKAAASRGHGLGLDYFRVEGPAGSALENR